MGCNSGKLNNKDKEGEKVLRSDLEEGAAEAEDLWLEEFTCPAVCCGLYIEDQETSAKREKKPLNAPARPPALPGRKAGLVHR